MTWKNNKPVRSNVSKKALKSGRNSVIITGLKITTRRKIDLTMTSPLKIASLEEDVMTKIRVRKIRKTIKLTSTLEVPQATIVTAVMNDYMAQG